MDGNILKVITEVSPPKTCIMSAQDIFPEFEEALNYGNITCLDPEQEFFSEMGRVVSTHLTADRVSEALSTYENHALMAKQSEFEDMKDDFPIHDICSHDTQIEATSTWRVNHSCQDSDICVSKHSYYKATSENNVSTFERSGRTSSGQLEHNLLNTPFSGGYRIPPKFEYDFTGTHEIDGRTSKIQYDLKKIDDELRENDIIHYRIFRTNQFQENVRGKNPGMIFRERISVTKSSFVHHISHDDTVSLEDGRSFTVIQRKVPERDQPFTSNVTPTYNEHCLLQHQRTMEDSTFGTLMAEDNRQINYEEKDSMAKFSPDNATSKCSGHILEEKPVMRRRNKNTEKKVMWALRLFKSWYLNSYKHNIFEKTTLLLLDNNELNKLLMRFITEVRNSKGEEYKVETLREILISLQYFLKQNGRSVQFSSDSAFDGLKTRLQVKTKTQTAMGYEVKKRKALPLTSKQEELLWRYGILGEDSPQQLLSTLFYLNAVSFGLKGAKEHRALKLGEDGNVSFQVINGIKHLKYNPIVGRTTKQSHGGSRDQSIMVGPNLDQPERCPVRLHEKYLDLRPKVFRPPFYLRPIRVLKEDGVWFSNVPIGCQHLAGMTRRLCASAGFQGFYTNFSLVPRKVSRKPDKGS